MGPGGDVGIVLIRTASRTHPLVVHVCATAHLPNVVLVGACGPALSELVVNTENVQFSGCGTES